MSFTKENLARKGLLKAALSGLPVVYNASSYEKL